MLDMKHKFFVKIKKYILALEIEGKHYGGNRKHGCKGYILPLGKEQGRAVGTSGTLTGLGAGRAHTF